MPSYPVLFSYNDLNNGMLRGIKAMPAKDLTSDGTAAFSTDRHAYAETYTPPQKANLTKKWCGGCRDASETIYRRRIASVGTSLNPGGQAFSFQSKTEKNTRIDALTRCRAGGACVPPKVRHSPSRTGVPMTNGTPNSKLYYPGKFPRSAARAVLGNHAPWA